MPLALARVRRYLTQSDFPGLFTQELGWDHHKATLEVAVDGRMVALSAVAEKRGMVAYQCAAPEGESIPPYALRRKIEQRVAKSVHEHLIVFTDAEQTTQVWQWVKREPGRPAACREHTFCTMGILPMTPHGRDARGTMQGQPGDALIQKLRALEVTLEEEEALTLIDTGHKVKAAFDVDKITKRFYDRFKTEHTGFLKFIKGFPAPVKVAGKTEPHPDLQWYTSLMLNRLMFVYFIQKKGFLDADPDYLRNRLTIVRQAQGKDKFQSFYRYFLLRLFHDGLGKTPAERGLDPAMEKLLGRVPFLDAGFFEVHELERRYADIDIPDRAFEKLFDFFDQYRWHLDERPLRADNEINPDVVGYIFEKYINQKQMGAYYTKQDITEYISKNTILPYLFDAAKKKCPAPFRTTGILPVENHAQDAHGTVRIRQGARLPHWTQEGATYAVTFRLGDSLPKSVLDAWIREREGIVATARQLGRPLSTVEEKRLRKLHSEKVESYLDAGHGACWMNQSRIAQIVAGALKHFEGDRYDLLAWCVMPNHVHVVVRPRSGHDLPSIVHSWKSFTANKANRLLERTGKFWQEEYYDHIIRDDDDFAHSVQYVLDNPRKANLQGWEWVGVASTTGILPVQDHGQDAHGTVWRLLRDAPDRYIYPAVRQGVLDEQGNVIPLPADIAAGLDDVARRDGWNRRADAPYALPTETWREHVARRRRCLEVREKLRAGEVHDINDLVTLNLDIWQFARDVILNAEGPELLRAFWKAIAEMTVLDPTCGSGAFLFAALRILETLYSDCLERMERFVEDLTGTRHHPEKYSDFKKVLAQLAEHPNERYFTLKSIIINNLYGVDIMEEAVEICKLRLFLKLVAQVDSVDQIEPLPDVDFNIRAGNTLVGYTSLEEIRRAAERESSGQAKLPFGDMTDAVRGIEEEAEVVERAFRQFRAQQTPHGGKVTAEDKQQLRARLAGLDAELDRYLAGEYGVNVEKQKDFDAWKASHEPFHWFVDFYGIMQAGGFDVIIGNPPYLELRQVSYTLRHFKTNDSAAIHAMCIERSLSILRAAGTMSMIVPLALVSTQRMTVVQQLIENGSSTWYANFAWRPGKLFDTVNRALTIFVLCRGNDGRTYSTNYQKWNSETRGNLIPTMGYCPIGRDRPAFWAPKLGDTVEQSILVKLLNVKTQVSDFMGRSPYLIYYRTTGGLYWKVFTDFAPEFKCNGRRGHSSRETTMTVAQSNHLQSSIALLSSNLFWWWYTVTSNLRDLNPSDIQGFPVPTSVLDDSSVRILGAKYLRDLQQNSTTLVRQQKQTGKTETQCFKIQKSKPIIDDIDRILARHYGFTDEELDFIINYDIKYRMGADGEDAEDK